jgi:AraC-like DNA-binding protein
MATDGSRNRSRRLCSECTHPYLVGLAWLESGWDPSIKDAAVLVLDTDQLPASQRAEAFQAAISGNASTSMAVFDDDVAVRAQLHVYELGPARVFNVEATGNVLHRTSAMARKDEQNAVAIAAPLDGRNLFRWGREEIVLQGRDMLLVDLDAPYEYGWRGSGSSYAFQVDRDLLDMPGDAIRRAAVNLPSSPLYPLVRDRLLHTTTNASRFTPDSASRLGSANLLLLRALIASAANGESSQTHSDAVMLHQVLHYARRYLTDPDLTPARIAAAHHISLRYLYLVCERGRIGLESWIVEHRLEAARAALASQAGRQRTIAGTAHAFGFTSPSFFTTRFKRAYGITPRQWQQDAATRAGSR